MLRAGRTRERWQERSLENTGGHWLPNCKATGNAERATVRGQSAWAQLVALDLAQG